MNSGYKFRIYPSAEQRVMFAKTFGCVRFVYNRMLFDKLEKKKSVTPAQYKEEFEWLREVDSLSLCNAQMNLKCAFENRRKNPKHFGKPHFKSKKNRQSYSTNNQKGSVRIEDGKIRLPKVGLVKIKLHRQIVGTIKTVTITKTPSDKYYVSILTDNGWGIFTQMLEYKLEWQGKSLVKIDKWYPSSQLCSHCDHKNSDTKNLGVRQWTCPKCGAEHDRDVNAAINIKNEGMRILA